MYRSQWFAFPPKGVMTAAKALGLSGNATVGKPTCPFIGVSVAAAVNQRRQLAASKTLL
jgi:hypothetical protein